MYGFETGKRRADSRRGESGTAPLSRRTRRADYAGPLSREPRYWPGNPRHALRPTRSATTTVLVAVADDGAREAVLDAAAGLGSAFDQDLYVVHLTENETESSEERELRDALEAELDVCVGEFTVGIEPVEHANPRSNCAVGRLIWQDVIDRSSSDCRLGQWPATPASDEPRPIQAASTASSSSS